MGKSRSIVEALQRSDLFSRLDAERLRTLATVARMRALSPGEVLISKEDPPADVFVVAAGRLRVIVHAPNGRSVLLRDVGPGQTIGELAALDGGERSATVAALTDAAVVRISGAAFRDLAASEPTVALSLAHGCIALVRDLTERIYEFGAMDIAGRIQSELLRLLPGGTAPGGELVIDPAPRHADIADRICARREAVSREMSRLARIGVVERRGRALVVKDIVLLRRMAEAAAGE